MDNLNRLLQMYWNIVDTATDKETKIRVGPLIDNCIMHKMDLSTNGVVITDATKYVNGKMDHLNNQEKKLLQDIKEGSEAEAKPENEQQTHNRIF